MLITLRPILPSDRPFEIALMRTAWEQTYDIMPGREEDKLRIVAQQVELQRAGYASQFKHASSRIIEADGRPVGRYIYEATPTEIFFIDIAILPEFRHQGIGMQVIEPELEAVRNGKTAYLHVQKGNNRAHLLYDRLGFELCGETPTHFRMKLTPATIKPLDRS